MTTFAPAMQAIEINNAFELAYRYVTETRLPIFLTGKAGTGKTTFLKYLREHCKKNMIVAAPTGVAAINAEGITLHSLFSLPFIPYIPTSNAWGAEREQVNDKQSLLAKLKYRKDKIKILQALDLLVIDEVSMVRADLLDQVDVVLRHVRKQYTIPFGGVQVLLIGDLQQLPPVVREHEWLILNQYYSTPFFFSAQVMQEYPPTTIELDKIYRQKEAEFISLLNQVRNGDVNQELLDTLNQRYTSTIPSDEYITLTSHNAQASEVNAQRLAALSGSARRYEAIIDGDFPESMYPAEQSIELKVGARVMFTKNDTGNDRKFFNGKIVEVTALNYDSVEVQDLTTKQTMTVTAQEWQNITYSMDAQKQELKENIVGTFSQLPFRLAWAITIHKSQGLTFDYIAIDAARAFASGQLYVALSRGTQLQGIALLSKIPASAIQKNNAVVQFMQQGNGIDHYKHITTAIQAYLQEITLGLFDFTAAQRELYFLEKLCQEHRGEVSQTNMSFVYEAQTFLRDKLHAVAAKFQEELKANQHNQTFVQERCYKARGYFIPLVQHLQSLITNHDWAIESKALADAIVPAVTALNDILSKKLFLYQNLPQQYTASILHELQTQMPVIKFDARVHSTKSNVKVPLGVPHPNLFTKLCELRNSLCEDNDMPVYRIANSATIVEMCTYLPYSESDLLCITGFGPAKVKQYGSEFLEILQRYMDTHNLQTLIEQHPKFKKPKKEKKEKAVKEKKPTSKKSEQQGDYTETVSATYELQQLGYSVQKIAAERGLAESTIYGHLSNVVAKQAIKCSDFLDKDSIAQIKSAINTVDGEKTLSSIRVACSNKYDFGIIRCVLAEWINEQHM